MVIDITSTAWPVWFRVVPAKSDTRSGYPIAVAREEGLVRFRYWLVSGGIGTRIACGTITGRNAQLGRNPSAEAASVRPWDTEGRAARNEPASAEGGALG